MKNKIYTTFVFLLLLHNSSNGQSVITNNKELYMKSHTENAELLKKSLEENLSSNLKEANEFKDRMEKILASDFKEIDLMKDSIKRGIVPESLKQHGNNKIYSIQKEGKNISIRLPSTRGIEYEEENMPQDSLMKKTEEFTGIELCPAENIQSYTNRLRLKQSVFSLLFPDEKIDSYTKQEQNKTTYISFSYRNIGVWFFQKEIEEDPPVERNSEFYPNGKLKRTIEFKFKNYSRIVVVEEISEEVIIKEELIGIGYLYDNNGSLVEAFEYDYDESLFEFTREDVMEYIKQETLGNNNIRILPQYTVNGEIKEEIRWEITLHEGMRVRRIVLNKTGEKVGDYFYRFSK
jgi:hypothetical protein